MKKIDYIWTTLCISCFLLAIPGIGKIRNIFLIVSILSFLGLLYEYKRNYRFLPTNKIVFGLLILSCIFDAVCWFCF